MNDPCGSRTASRLSACRFCSSGWALAPPGLFADYRTGTGERRTVALSDGSSIELGPLSALSLGDGASRRVLRLERGEIFVTVAPDAGRPFVIEALGGAGTARGTAFNMKLDAATVEVATQEGVVEVRGRHARDAACGGGGQLRGLADLARATGGSRGGRRLAHGTARVPGCAVAAGGVNWSVICPAASSFSALRATVA